MSVILVCGILTMAASRPASADQPEGVVRTFAVLFSSLEPPDLQFQSDQSLGLVVLPDDPLQPPAHFRFCQVVYNSGDWETHDLLHVTTQGAETIPATVIWSAPPPTGATTFTGPDSPLVLSQEVLFGHAATGFPCSGSYSGAYYADSSPSGAAFGMVVVTAVFNR
jgi:hypothetical protein